jgi:hypothetical protein
MSRVSAATTVLAGVTADVAMLKTKNNTSKIGILFFIYAS